MVYVEPALIQQVLGGRPLPFVEGGLSADPRLKAALLPLLQGLDEDLEPLARDDAIYDLAWALDAVAGRRNVRRLPGPGGVGRSGERRVGEECRSRWSADHYKKKKEYRASC